jgi:hypothetical protein
MNRTCTPSWGSHADDVVAAAVTHLRSRRNVGSQILRIAAAAAVAMLVLAICGCTAGEPQFTPTDPANFWLGLWHGAISVVTLIIGIFEPSVLVYERNNTGGWYDFGFLLGVISVWGGSSSAGYHRSRRRRRNRFEADTVI